MRLDFDYMGIAKFLIERSSLLELPGGEHIRFLEAYINSLCEDRVRFKAAEKQRQLLRTFAFGSPYIIYFVKISL